MSVLHSAACFLVAHGSGSWDPHRNISSGVTLSCSAWMVFRSDDVHLAGGSAPARKKGRSKESITNCPEVDHKVWGEKHALSQGQGFQWISAPMETYSDSVLSKKPDKRMRSQLPHSHVTHGSSWAENGPTSHGNMESYVSFCAQLTGLCQRLSITSPSLVVLPISPRIKDYYLNALILYYGICP